METQTKKMLTENNFFTLIKKWTCKTTNSKEPPRFFKQSINLQDKIFAPYDELGSWMKHEKPQRIIPHFFISDQKQTCFAGDPAKHSDILDSCFAVFSPDYSVFTNAYTQFNNAMILLNRLIASYWQSLERYVILTLSWAGGDTYDTAFSNIEKNCVVAISTEGVSDWECFKNGFLELLKRIEPQKICWYGKIPNWAYDYYDSSDIIRIKKRHIAIKEKELASSVIIQPCLL